MKKIGFLVIFMVFISSALAQNALMEEYSQELQGQELEGALGTLFGDDKINLYMKNDEGTIVIGIVTEDKVVKSIEEGELEKPSLNVYTDEDTIMKIQNSDNPLQELKKSLDEGKVRYEAIGFFNKIKFSFLSIFSNIASMFTSDVEEKEEVKVEIHKEDVIKEDKVEKVDDNSEDLNEDSEENETEDSEVEDDGGLLTGEATAEIPDEEQNVEHVVELTINGFEPYKISVKAGDMVTWKNARKGTKFNQGMIIGVRECRDVRSGVLESGEEYSYTFEEPAKCTIVDGIWTTKDSKVNIE